MAKIVMVAEGTLRPGINEVGDHVQLAEDEAQLSPRGYGSMDVVEVPGVSELYVRAIMAEAQPKMISDPETNETIWLDESDGKWKTLTEQDKHAIRWDELTAEM